jgi:hypothetical protein
MSNETITPERIALPKQVVDALAEAWRNDDVCNDGERKILELGARIALAALANEPVILSEKDAAFDDMIRQDGVGASIHWSDAEVCFVATEWQRRAFLAPQPKISPEVESIVDDYAVSLWGRNPAAAAKAMLTEMAQKISELKAKHRALPSAAEQPGDPALNPWLNSLPTVDAKPADWEEARRRVKTKHYEAEYAERGNQQSAIWLGQKVIGVGWDEPSAWLDAASRLSTSGAGLETQPSLTRFKCEHGTDSLKECPMCMAEAEPRLTEKQLSDFRRQWHGNYINSLAQEVYESRQKAKPEEPVGYFYRRGAERLADAVDALIRRRVVGSRSEAADALLDFRDGDVGRSAKPEMAPDAGFLAWATTIDENRKASGIATLTKAEIDVGWAAWIAARKGGRS